MSNVVFLLLQALEAVSVEESAAESVVELEVDMAAELEVDMEAILAEVRVESNKYQIHIF